MASVLHLPWIRYSWRGANPVRETVGREVKVLPKNTAVAVVYDEQNRTGADVNWRVRQ
jgi:hypothetical protein